MNKIKYLSFDQASPEDLLKILNEDSLREHLIDHPYFDNSNLQAWIEDKTAINEIQGCRIRAVYINGVLAGWCGIQPDDNGFELAIVISQRFWGSGISIFKTLMCWAKEFRHKEVLFHLLDTRPEYKALKKISTKVNKSELAGQRFTTYYIPVDKG